jgi:hypothetical protein
VPASSHSNRQKTRRRPPCNTSKFNVMVRHVMTRFDARSSSRILVVVFIKTMRTRRLKYSLTHTKYTVSSHIYSRRVVLCQVVFQTLLLLVSFLTVRAVQGAFPFVSKLDGGGCSGHVSELDGGGCGCSSDDGGVIQLGVPGAFPLNRM